MTYATQARMLDRFGESEIISLTDRGNMGMIDSDVLNRALETADSEINTYLLNRYTLPLATVPLVLADKACDIARYLLCGAEVVATEDTRERYKDALKFLEKVQMGKASLGLDSNSVEAPVNAQAVSSSRPRVFTSDSLSDY